MNASKKSCLSDGRFHSFLTVWVAAFIGIVFFIPMIPKLVPAQTPLPFSMNTLIIISVLQSVVFITLFAAAGAMLAPRMGFRAALADIPIKKKIPWKTLKTQFVFGLPTGLAGAMIAYFFAPEFTCYLGKFPVLSRLFGGIYEEVIIRWGIMTVIAWVIWRVFQHGIGIPKESVIRSGILISQILFAAGHIPMLIRLGVTDPYRSVLAIFIVSLPWGWLFWKKGLEAAFIAHASFHAFTAFFTAVHL
jgi:hypothetical protein